MYLSSQRDIRMRLVLAIQWSWFPSTIQPIIIILLMTKQSYLVRLPNVIWCIENSRNLVHYIQPERCCHNIAKQCVIFCVCFILNFINITMLELRCIEWNAHRKHWYSRRNCTTQERMNKRDKWMHNNWGNYSKIWLWCDAPYWAQEQRRKKKDVVL